MIKSKLNCARVVDIVICVILGIAVTAAPDYISKGECKFDIACIILLSWALIVIMLTPGTICNRLAGFNIRK